MFGGGGLGFYWEVVEEEEPEFGGKSWGGRCDGCRRLTRRLPSCFCCFAAVWFWSVGVVVVGRTGSVHLSLLMWGWLVGSSPCCNHC